MKVFRLALAVVFVASTSLLMAQGAGTTDPLIADVHSAPYRSTINYRTNVSSGRFDMRHATVFDMIEFAYGLGEPDDDRENPAIVGGPAWIDFDRFDVSAKISAGKASSSAANEQMRAVLKRVLAERFHLKYHTEDRPLPGFVVGVAKEGPKLAEAKAPAAENECHGAREKANPEQYTITCTSETVGRFVATLDQDFPHTIVDRTGLTKAYDFALRLTLGPDVHTRDDRARVYTEAMGKQLGLVVTRGGVPQPALVVDMVDRTPTANLPEIAKLIPALPDLEFEVASIRPAADNEPQSQIRPTGSQITFSSMQLSELIVRAWQLPTAQVLGDALPLLPKTRFTILVKLPPEVDGWAVSQDRDQIANVLQKLLIDRFRIKYHWGNWIQPDAYVLLAENPKMKKADPGSRSFCKYGPVEGERAARFAGSAFDGEFHCQNVTMGQFADEMQALAGADVKNRVADKTGLEGAYDFGVFFTVGRTLRSRTAAAVEEAKRNGDASATPVAGLSLEDAFRRQLGLRLEKQPLTLPALILDHFEQTPTAN